MTLRDRIARAEAYRSDAINAYVYGGVWRMPPFDHVPADPLLEVGLRRWIRGGRVLAALMARLTM